jgi:glycosyltransferase involved in cell wall biosynthesis
MASSEAAAANGATTSVEVHPPISVMIFTLDEEVNLPRCLSSLGWCDDVIVIDSFSHDRTEEISRKAGARFFQNPFRGFGAQRNWAVDNTSPRHDWILVLDADERVPAELAEEMGRAVRAAPPGVGAFRVRRRFYLWGRWLQHSSLYPTWVVRLIHKDRARYFNRGHSETQEVEGEIRELDHDLIDENDKGIDEWFERQLRYAAKEAEFELGQEAAPAGKGLSLRDPIARRQLLKRMTSRLPGRAIGYFLYAYVARRGFLDGADGLVFCSMKALYQQMIVVKKYDLRRRAGAR